MIDPDDIAELIPGHIFRDNDPTTLYWIRDKTVVYRHYPLRGADVESFRFYKSSLAKDHRHCYVANSRLTDGNGPTFRPLNFSYYTDGNLIWTFGGQIKEADAESFVTCDDGMRVVLGAKMPFGYARDKNHVYYYDNTGKPKLVRKASPASFVSFNDGEYGMDENFIFCGAATIPKADVTTWKRLRGPYSRDGYRAFWLTREIKGADLDSFVAPETPFFPVAQDKNHYYSQDQIIDRAEFETHLK